MAYLSQSESPLPSPAPESWSGPARVNISIASSPDALGCPWGPWPWFRWRQIKSEKLWKHVRKVKSWSRWTSRLPDFPGLWMRTMERSMVTAPSAKQIPATSHAMFIRLRSWPSGDFWIWILHGRCWSWNAVAFISTRGKCVFYIDGKSVCFKSEKVWKPNLLHSSSFTMSY